MPATLNLASLLEHPARLTPDRIAITGGPVSLTYADLDARACRVAGALAALGIGAGDHVALSCPNVPWFPIAYFGILKAGAVVVPLNILLRPREIAYHLKDADAAALLVFEGTPELPMGSMALAACAELPGVALAVMTVDPEAPSPIAGAHALGRLMREAGPVTTPPRAMDDTAVILYTSGTTGQSKGAELTHATMALNAMVSYDMLVGACAAGTEQNVMLVTLPLFHATAQTTQMNAALYGSLRLVLLPRFEPAAVLQAMAREQVGFWVAVPTMYWTLLQHRLASGTETSAIPRSLRLCASGGAPMPLELLHDFERTFGVRILEGYGLSETAPVASFNQVHRPSKPGTVGLPIFGVEIRCVDDNDQPVPAGERGEVVIRGHNVMKGYYKRPEATAEALRNGWFHTGDIGTLDEDGYLAIVDRKKDMILRGGFNVYPREIEEVLMTHPGVALCAVIGVPDERLGEEVKAFVVRKPSDATTEQELMDWCRDQLAAYKYPRQIEFREALPLSATGKILKRELRQSP